MDGLTNSKAPSLAEDKKIVKWLEIEIKADAGLEEAFYDLLTERHLDGWVVEAETPQLVWVCYMACTGDWEVRWSSLVSAVQMYDAEVRVRKTVVDEDWVNCWKQFYHVHHIGQGIVVCPSWEEYQPQAHEHIITLDPGMAFGTGYHGSTSSCLVLLEDYLRQNRALRVMDVGTGSGILAIAAAFLGAESVDASDISATAVQVAQENARLNGLQERITVVEGSGVGAGQYDLIIANIVAAVIMSLAPDFREHLLPGGSLIVSGIIEERRDEVVEVLSEYGFGVVDERLEDEWVSLRLTLQ